MQAVVESVRVEFRIRRCGIAFEIGREHVAMRPAAVGWVELPESTDIAALHGAKRNLIRGIPARVIPLQRYADDTVTGCMTVPNQSVVFAIIIRCDCRIVFVPVLECVEQMASRADGRRGCQEQSRLAVRATADARDLVRQRVKVRHAHRTRRREIALVRKVRAFTIIDEIYGFRNQPIDITIALTVRVCPHVRRNATDRDGDIGTVVEVEASKIILIGFAFTRMLRDDDAGNRLEKFAWP